MREKVAWLFLLIAIPVVSSKADEPIPSAGPSQKGPVDGAVKLGAGQLLFRQHCAGCHGVSGDGKGPAAAFLFPKPRNFYLGKFRLVSTENGVPTETDLETVLVRGMPGSSMPSWAHLSREDRALLVAEIYRLTAEGARDRFIRNLKDNDGLTDEEIEAPDIQAQIADVLKLSITPSEVQADAETNLNDASITRGRQLYVQQGCHSCHGAEAKGDGVQTMIDYEGYPTRPRDLTKGIFKGAHDPASIYRRIFYGMPGSPMPSSKNLTPAQIRDLSLFLLSLSTELVRESVVLKREKIVVRYVRTLPAGSNANDWSKASAAELRLTPLWWRDDYVKNVQVQAMHDGRSIAFRLEWEDATPNKHAGKVEAFKDAIALELVRGAEPFLGMGSTETPIDLWMWDADRGQSGGELEDVNPRVVVDVYPFTEQTPESAEYARQGTKTSNQAEIALPAKAVGNQITRAAPHPTSGSSLTAAGPGSTTFRIAQSQLVSASGRWNQGRWTVLLRRSLNVRNPDDGLLLASGQTASLALAVWDGSQRDRNGQKQVSIWHDLVLEASR